MGLYEVVVNDRSSPGLSWVADAKSYTLYERGHGLWYVNFVASCGRQVRLATGCRDHASAKALIESYRAGPKQGPAVKVNNKHIHRMIERARARAMRRKGLIPFALSLDAVKAAVERCKGYCEVTGHALEDSGPFRPSLDRIDPARGYVQDNIRIVCLITNTAMLHYGEAALAELAITYCRNAGLLPATASV